MGGIILGHVSAIRRKKLIWQKGVNVMVAKYQYAYQIRLEPRSGEKPLVVSATSVRDLREKLQQLSDKVETAGFWPIRLRLAAGSLHPQLLAFGYVTKKGKRVMRAFDNRPNTPVTNVIDIGYVWHKTRYMPNPANKSGRGKFRVDVRIRTTATPVTQ
jgi:hypothetical protein